LKDDKGISALVEEEQKFGVEKRESKVDKYLSESEISRLTFAKPSLRYMILKLLTGRFPSRTPKMPFNVLDTTLVNRLSLQTFSRASIATVMSSGQLSAALHVLSSSSRKDPQGQAHSISPNPLSMHLCEQPALLYKQEESSCFRRHSVSLSELHFIGSLANSSYKQYFRAGPERVYPAEQKAWQTEPTEFSELQ